MPLRLRDLNKKVVEAQYAVRGALALRAEQIKAELAADPNSHPFSRVINSNIGNPQQLDQKPITFFRQVLSLVQYPQLLDEPPKQFPTDAVARARKLVDHIGSVGAYSASNGVQIVRESVARFISERDGFPSDPEDIFLSGGASAAASKLVTLVSNSPKAGILVPIPQYPLYSATIALQGAAQIDYYLDEKNAWKTSTQQIEEATVKAKEDGLDPKMLVVINPGNPTGAVLTHEDIVGVIDVALKHDLVVVADEVYQNNIFDGEFVSFKRVRSELVQKDSKYEKLQLASLQTTSKGNIGECGQRGGYMEIVGFEPEVRDEIYKLASIELCPVVTGQVLTEVMVNPPKEGEPSYKLWHQETQHVHETLYQRALQLYHAFEEMEGVTCNRPQGAMYLFPQIRLPQKAIDAAKEKGQAPDEMYCMDLLNETGICVVPGSGFGQEPGTFHFRTTFLAPGGNEFSDMFVKFHNNYMKKYA